MTAHPTYQEILDAEQKLPPMIGGNPLAKRINEILASAEDNAQDNDGRIASIFVILSFERNPAVLDWFQSLGIKA